MFNNGSLGNISVSKWSKYLSLGYLYDAEVLKNGLMNMIVEGDQLKEKAYPKTFVVSTPKDQTRPYLFRNYPNSKSSHVGTDEETILNSCMATSAAPIYYEPHKFEGQDYVDGGLVANNPTNIALKESKTLYNFQSYSNKIDVVVSLGTGNLTEENRPTGQNNQNGVQVFRELFRNLVKRCTDSYIIHEKVAQKLTKHNIPYYRFNPDGFGNISLDSTDENVIDTMSQKTDEYIANQNDMFDQCAGLLLNKL